MSLNIIRNNHYYSLYFHLTKTTRVIIFYTLQQYMSITVKY